MTFHLRVEGNLKWKCYCAHSWCLPNKLKRGSWGIRTQKNFSTLAKKKKRKEKNETEKKAKEKCCKGKNVRFSDWILWLNTGGRRGQAEKNSNWKLPLNPSVRKTLRTELPTVTKRWEWRQQEGQGDSVCVPTNFLFFFKNFYFIVECS